MGLPGVASQFTTFSPLKTMGQIRAEGTTGALPLLPYSSMVCVGSTFGTYGLLVDTPAIYLAQIPNIILGSYYCFEFARHAPKGASNLPGTLGMHAAGVATVVTTVAGAALTLDKSTAATTIGIIGDVLVVSMFGGPLVAIRTVLKEKSTRALPLPFTLASFTDTGLWTLYGTTVLMDPFIILPNSLGFFSSIIQLGLHARFGGNPKPQS